MQAFFLNNYAFITYFVEVMAAFTGLLMLKKFKGSSSKYFIFFLFYIVICEFIAGYNKLVYPNKLLSFLLGTPIEKNYWFSTLYWKIGAIMFFSFYYRSILKTSIFKILIKYSSYSFLIFSIIYISLNFKKYFNSYFPIISVLGAVIIFICTVLYFIELLRSEKMLTFYKSLNFYITSAIFIWWLIITPIIFYDHYGAYEVLVKERDIHYIQLRMSVYLFSNVVMYSIFTFALIWCRPEND